jgi:hypothetical protein
MPRVPARTDKAPKPAGPYNQAVRIDNIVAAAGQAGFTPTGDLVEGVGAQTKQALANIAAALEAAGCLTRCGKISARRDREAGLWMDVRQAPTGWTATTASWPEWTGWCWRASRPGAGGSRWW